MHTKKICLLDHSNSTIKSPIQHNKGKSIQIKQCKTCIQIVKYIWFLCPLKWCKAIKTGMKKTGYYHKHYPHTPPKDHFFSTWTQTSHCPFLTKSHVKGSNCVKWSWYTTLKINNKHQTKVSAHFVFFPVCKYSVLVCPTGFEFFFSVQIKA